MSNTALSSKLDKLASTVPSLPGVVHELQKALNNMDTSMNALEQIVNKDPAFSARLLKLANSAYYGFSFKISTISQALMMLGLSELRSLMIATSISRMFKGIDGNLISMESFWRHSVACGICARNLAIKYRENNIEEFFIAGLMHDLGRLVFLCNLPEKTVQASQLAFEKHIPITKAENEVLSFNHADLISKILTEWKLPEMLREMVSMHHQPVSSSPYYRQGMIIHTADVIVDAMEIGNSGERTIAPVPNALDSIKNYETVFPSLIDEVDCMTEDLVRIFISDK